MTNEFFEIDLNKYKSEALLSGTRLCHSRKKIINDTPEEIVRQAFYSYLTKEKGYPEHSIAVEVSMTDFKKGAVGRADMIIYDEDRLVVCVVECKRDGEYITDSIWDQVLTYSELGQSPSVCILSGNKAIFWGVFANQEYFYLNEFPAYKNLIEFNFDQVFDYKLPPFVHLETSAESYKLLQDHAIIGTDTAHKYYPFLVKLFNLYLSEAKIIFDDNSVKDIGKTDKKFGNSSGGGYPGVYRSFLKQEDSLVVSFAISSTCRGEGHPTHTTLLFAVQEKTAGKTNNHMSLQLRVDKHIELLSNEALITHDGTITIGKQGPGKKQELLDFVSVHNAELIKGGTIFLGKLNFEKEIHPESPETKKFINNSIEYALLRDKFRKSKK